MSLNNYILSGSGFFKGVSFDIDKKEHVIEWTNLLREAVSYKASSAHSLIKKYNLNAFVWNPYAEEPTRNKWRVVRRSSHYDFSNYTTHEALEWRPEKVTMESKTDVKFLSTRNSTPEELFDSFEDAAEEAKKRNEKIIIELQEKNNLLLKK